MKKTSNVYFLFMVAIVSLAFFAFDNVYAADSDEQEMIKICMPIANDIAEKKFGYVEQEIISDLSDIEIAKDIALVLQKKDILKKQNENSSVIGNNWFSIVFEKIKNIKLINEL